jgi:hypothetical protein
MFSGCHAFLFVTLQEVMMHPDYTTGVVTVFDIEGVDERTFSTWLGKNRDTGYVGNIPRKKQHNSGADLLLHCARCSWLAGHNGPYVNQDFYKVCSTDIIDLLHWIHHNGPFKVVRACNQFPCKDMIIWLHKSQINLI